MFEISVGWRNPAIPDLTARIRAELDVQRAREAEAGMESEQVRRDAGVVGW
ncbi:hypothetical protein [Aurantiacibacter flavus]|uniref:Uncharacterized protein n=1 Tax=Aurantiacibacter flavus TaxID=3145232 RepID=A0ABV0CTC4_9SPHN